MSFWLTALLSLAASAYVPEYATIASHAADQHGRGAYLIEQEVSWRKDAETYTVKETWQVLSENDMKLTLEGRGPLKGLVQGSIVYEGMTKYFMDPGQGLRKQRLGEDWLEPLLHFRSSKYFRSRLAALRVAPPESLRDRPPLASDGDPKYSPPGFVRLSRVGGDVAWAIGVPPTVGIAPTVWIEQDQFVLRKYRGADQVTLTADDYTKYDQGLWYPRTRAFTYGAYNVEIQTLHVKSLGKLRANDTRFKPASLKAADGLKLPEVDALKEFYSRFR
jgi:hypothetical protein